MPIKNIQIDFPGDSGTRPRLVRIETNDTVEQVTSAGYLNKARNLGYQFSEDDLIAVTTRTSPNAQAASVAWYDISISSNNITLVASGGGGGDLELPDGQIYVGNASNEAAAVQMSGDVTIDNAGATTIGSGVVEQSMLETQLQAPFVVFAAGKVLYTGGGTGNVQSISVPGILSTDVIVVMHEYATQAGGAPVEMKVNRDTDEIVVDFSDGFSFPGSSDSLNYIVYRAVA